MGKYTRACPTTRCTRLCFATLRKAGERHVGPLNAISSEESHMKLGELAFACYIYGRMSDYDSSYRRFVKATRPELDLRSKQHLLALLKWLNEGMTLSAKNFTSMGQLILIVFTSVLPKIILQNSLRTARRMDLS